MTRNMILVVDDDVSLRRVLKMQLEEAGYDVVVAADGREAQDLINEHQPKLVITDLRMPGSAGMELLRYVRDEHLETTVIMITAFGSVETAVEAMKSGAYDYITKPIDYEALVLVVHRAMERQNLLEEVRTLRTALDQRYGFEGIIGRSKSILRVLEMASRVAQHDSTVLIRGETGTGKELLARAIHHNSRRKNKPFVTINCGAIPKELIESELFGYTRGAFTGAVAPKPGKIEMADTGTLFLDEVGELPADMQVKLLRMLQNGELEKIGATGTTVVNVRVIAATNRNLQAMIEDGAFREDLYYRLAVVPLELPPLRERKQDIPFLANHFLKKLAPETGTQVEAITDAGMEKLIAYHWPGNVRELENVIERSLVMAAGTKLDADDIKMESAPRPRPQNETSGFLPPGMTLDEYEQEIIREALKRADGNKSQAARLLGLTRNALRYRLTQMGLES